MMTRLGPALACAVFLLTAYASLHANSDESLEDAIAKDQKWIRGTWRATEIVVDGNKLDKTASQDFTVINKPQGDWVLFNKGKEIAKGTSTIDPTRKPKTLDFKASEDDRNQAYLAIYEYGETTRKMCFSEPGDARPSDFTAPSGSKRILVTFERQQAEKSEPEPAPRDR
jgi:uncharacterized protein (TIGR03067 family)